MLGFMGSNRPALDFGKKRGLDTVMGSGWSDWLEPEEDEEDVDESSEEGEDELCDDGGFHWLDTFLFS